MPINKIEEFQKASQGQREGDSEMNQPGKESKEVIDHFMFWPESNLNRFKQGSASHWQLYPKYMRKTTCCVIA